VLARIRLAQGKSEAASAAMEQGLRIARGNDIPRLVTLVSAYRARIWLAQQQTEAAAHWAEEYGRLEPAEYLREFEELTLVRVLLARGLALQAVARLDALLHDAEAAGREATVIEGEMLRALALDAQNSTGPALDALERALQRAEPEGYVRLFVDEGRLLRDLLSRGRGALGSDASAAYARMLLAEFAPTQGPSLPSAHPRPARLMEPLTPRELEVLELLAEGLTNPEIAQRLVISLPTVKSHTRNLYQKLDVHRRREAVAQAQTLGLLP
jgi:LuxR family maltose regulon positive regulatory protein